MANNHMAWCHCEKCATPKHWVLLPLRIATGLMFLSAGLPKLISMISGNPAVPNFFTALGIPAPVFFAWLVAFVEVIGGAMLIAGLFTWWASFVFSIELIVIILVAIVFRAPLNLLALGQHLVFLSSTVALMYSKSLYMSLDRAFCWKPGKKPKK